MNPTGNVVPSPPAEVLYDSRFIIVHHRGSAAAATFRRAFVILVVTTPPHSRLIATLGSAIEPLIHSPKSIQSAGERGISVINDAVLEHERAHARSLAQVGIRVSSGHLCVLNNRRFL